MNEDPWMHRRVGGGDGRLAGEPFAAHPHSGSGAGLGVCLRTALGQTLKSESAWPVPSVEKKRVRKSVGGESCHRAPSNKEEWHLLQRNSGRRL